MGELLPVRARSFVTTLGEGATRLLAPARLARKLGVAGLHIKAESANPTGSFKVRGMAVAVSHAAELGATHLVAPSAGNAAGALAAYAAAAGLRATVVMPADAPVSNQQEAIACGARLILLDGLISDCGRLARLVCDQTGAFDMGPCASLIGSKARRRSVSSWLRISDGPCPTPSYIRPVGAPG